MQAKDALRLRIYELCRGRHLTVSGLSMLCGITQSTLCNILSGRNDSAYVSTIQKICDGLEMDLPVFFDSELFRNAEPSRR